MRSISPFVATVPLLACATAGWAAEFLTVEQAWQSFFPNGTELRADPVQLTRAQQKEIQRLSGVRQRSNTQAVWRVQSEGKAIGWFVLDHVIGKHEYIDYAVGITMDGKVAGIEILSYRETHGGQVREESWRKNFIGKTLADPFRLDADIPNISGATLSCRNLMNGVKRLLALWRVALAGS